MKLVLSILKLTVLVLLAYLLATVLTAACITLCVVPLDPFLNALNRGDPAATVCAAGVLTGATLALCAVCARGDGGI